MKTNYTPYEENAIGYCGFYTGSLRDGGLNGFILRRFIGTEGEGGWYVV